MILLIQLLLLLLAAFLRLGRLERALHGPLVEGEGRGDAIEPVRRVVHLIHGGQRVVRHGDAQHPAALQHFAVLPVETHRRVGPAMRCSFVRFSGRRVVYSGRSRD